MDLAPIEFNAVKFDMGLGSLSRRDKKQLQKVLPSIFRSAVCFQQGQIAQHFLLGNEYHKTLRLALRAQDAAKVEATITTFNRLHFEALRSGWMSAVNHLFAYFTATHNPTNLPRMCIKGTVKNPNSNLANEKLIVDILREDGTRSKYQSRILLNSGFKAVHDTGKFYLENDIPEAVKLREYKNPRLIHHAAAAYRNPVLRGFFQKEDKAWINCWQPSNDTPVSASSCYKSTLIVPMTLVNNSLSEAFFEDTVVGIETQVDRSIYGFLCFDHPKEKFFNEADVNVGYIFSDLLSIYLITRDALVSHSSVYADAKHFLNRSQNGNQVQG